MKKRWLSVLLACCMVLTLLPVAALAEDSAESTSEGALTSAAITFPAPVAGEKVGDGSAVSADENSGLTTYLFGPALWQQDGKHQKLDENSVYADGSVYWLQFTFYTQKPITVDTAVTFNGESVSLYTDIREMQTAAANYDGSQDDYLALVQFSAEGTGDPSMADVKNIYILHLFAFVHATKAQTVAEVSTEKELTDALSGQGDVVKLTGDITIKAGLKVQRDVTVDLNGHVLRYDKTADPDSIFRVVGGKTLTLTDSRPEAEHEDETLPAGGLITGGKGYPRDNGSGQYISYFGGGVYVESGASFVLAGGTIYACGVQSGATSAFGGGIYADGGSVTMTGGAIRNCVLSTDLNANGGGVYIYSLTSWASFTMTGGIIAGCSADRGGGILASGCTVRITGGSIENCKASERGGGLSVSGHTNGPVSLLDAAISGCEAKYGGGVALIGYAELELGENARITGCTATEKDDTEAGAVEYGAAVYMDPKAPGTANYPGCFLYANGGRVEGSVYVGRNDSDNADTIKATNAIDHTDEKPSTVFTGDVYCEGDIRGGSFYGSVTVLDPYGYMSNQSYRKFCSNLSGGSFYGPVRTECHVSGGTYYAGLTLGKNAKLSGKPIQTEKLDETTNTPNPNGDPVTVIYKDGSGEYAKQIVQKGEKAIEPDVPSRTGHQFTGWYLGDAKYDFGTAVTGKMTLTAQWTVNQYTITFDTNGGSAIAPITQDYGTAITAPDDPTKSGYTFAGWTPAIPATMPAEDLTVTAQWRYNGGGGGGGSTTYTIQATAGANGSVSPSGSVSVREGRDQTFTFAPDRGYAVADVTIDGQSVGAGTSYTFENVRKAHTVAVTFAKTSAFTDVPAGSYYEDAVAWAVANGITTGTDAAHFAPDGSCTRAQAVTFLWRAAGSPAPESTAMPYTDVPAGSYYHGAVLWAVEQGITKGTSDTTFSPDATCTRAQIVTFLWRAEKAPAAGDEAQPFTDVAADAYYADAVLWAVENGITKGTTDTTFGPNEDCTRAQIVTFLWRSMT